jgi:hypothetical protein
MKRFFTSIAFTILLSATAFAHNGPEKEGKDPDKPAKESQYTFSLSKAYFSIFNLFKVDQEPVDTTTKKVEDLEAQLLSILYAPQ